MVIRSLVAVVDDDESVRESLPDLLRVCPKTSGGITEFSEHEAD